MNNHPIKFGGRNYSDSGIIMVLLRQVISQVILQFVNLLINFCQLFL